MKRMFALVATLLLAAVLGACANSEPQQGEVASDQPVITVYSSPT